MLSCQMPRTTLLVVSQSKLDIVMHLTHSHPLGGHLGVHNTITKLRDRFHWPSMEAEVKNFCQQ